MAGENFSFAQLGNLEALEALFAQYQKDSTSVDPSWRFFFEGMVFGASRKGEAPKESSDLRVHLLIHAYRTYGHLRAKVNPIALTPPAPVPELELGRWGFSQEELEKNFPTIGFLKEPQAPLKKIVEALEKTYCGTIGVEYMGLGEPKMEAWLQERIEPHFELNLTPEEKIEILHSLNRAELFESFIHTKYVGQKRFSLEGEDTIIPMLVALLERGAEEGVGEAVLGMAHRGRLNVLANILNKSYAQIFHEFEDHYTPDLNEGTGDVKYHKGFEGALKTKKGKEIKVTLSPNPSHLESVDPVVVGQARARQEVKGDKTKRREVVPILIHGDAAIAGQGVVYETLQLCRLNGYATGGTIHIVINNQIGFTTLPKDTRSTHYCTDIAKGFGAPIFHLNAEDPEGCAYAAKLAISLRQAFQCDVFLDVIGYRKYGHNEGDEPTFTQPLEYQQIHKKLPIRTVYGQKLIAEKVLDAARVEKLEQEFKASLQQALEQVPKETPLLKKEGPPKVDLFQKIDTAVPAQTLQELAQIFNTPPEGFHIHPKVKRLLQERLAMVQEDPAKSAVDWGMGEHLAYATLLTEGIHLRITGQDVRRGTFSHRHAMWVDQETEGRYFPLAHLKPTQASFDIFNSPLSEYAALAFEFGYSLDYPHALTIWEAQFGDFVNGAEIVLDQYLSAAEQKWGVSTNLTLLLPHGYEGQGPEHSSARIERFLQLSGEDNMFVANVTTPAQFFHLLRRQAKRKEKKPLIVFTPKALLRHPQNKSPLNAFTAGIFEEFLDDPFSPKNPRRLIFCSGKIFYELAAEREKRKAFDIAIVRVEQLYPLNKRRMHELMHKYWGFKECFWVQEEHSNMGAWEYMRPHIEEELEGAKVRYVGRGRSASAAAGSHALHKKQGETLLNEAFS